MQRILESLKMSDLLSPEVWTRGKVRKITFFSGRLPANDLFCNFCKGSLTVEIHLEEVLK